jgi:hypothetical protein
VSGDQLAEDLRGNRGGQDFVGGLAAGAVGLSTTLVGLVLQGFTVGLFTFYLVADGPRLRRTVCSVLPPAARRWRCASGTWPSTAPAATFAPGSCSAATAVFLSTYLHRYEVVASPLTGAAQPAAAPAHEPPRRAGAERTRRVE